MREAADYLRALPKKVRDKIAHNTLKRTDMKQEMELIPFENLLTEFYGEVGTPERDEFEL